MICLELTASFCSLPDLVKDFLVPVALILSSNLAFTHYKMIKWLLATVDDCLRCSHQSHCYITKAARSLCTLGGESFVRDKLYWARVFFLKLLTFDCLLSKLLCS
jgi:hypothetical protein